MNTKNWFEVDTEGLKALQAGKPKHYILRELVQNAWDEDITECKVDTDFNFSDNTCTITVTDDNPEGFKNLRDTFVLFGDTVKRRDVTKRGRFNLGEKQAIAICESAEVSTTKGTVIFDKEGRRTTDKRTTEGSTVTLNLKMTNKQYEKMLDTAEKYLTPKNIRHIVNGEEIPYRKPFIVARDYLPTQFEVDGQLRNTERITDINLIEQEEGYLYEMGLPVIKLGCPFAVDVQQKIPMSVDRESVTPKYLKRLYGVVLNNTIDELNPEQSSDTWVRIGSGSDTMTQETMQKLIEKRFGGKVVVANPLDPVANDDALAEGYKVIYGRELSKAEWANIKVHNLIQSATSLFGKGIADDIKPYEPDENMRIVEKLAKKIAKRFLKRNINVNFYTSIQTSSAASYGNGCLDFNITRLGKAFFEKPVSVKTIDIIVHELGHEKGMHTETDYHKLITKLAGELTITALNEPAFFNEGFENYEAN